jgi:hypothetical protein
MDKQARGAHLGLLITREIGEMGRSMLRNAQRVR